MSVVAIPKRRIKAAVASTDWVNVAAGGALVAGGLLLLTRRRKAGVAVAAAGTALALLEHKETVRSWWIQLPGLVENVQDAVAQVQSRIRDLADRRDAIVESISSLGESR